MEYGHCRRRRSHASAWWQQPAWYTASGADGGELSSAGGESWGGEAQQDSKSGARVVQAGPGASWRWQNGGQIAHFAGFGALFGSVLPDCAEPRPLSFYTKLCRRCAVQGPRAHSITCCPQECTRAGRSRSRAVGPSCFFSASPAPASGGDGGDGGDAGYVGGD